VRNHVKVLPQVGIDHFGLAHAQSFSDRFRRLMAPSRPKTERLRMEVLLENCYQHRMHRHLHHAFFAREYPALVILRWSFDLHAARRRWPVRFAATLLSQRV
jgi:hypothetical protein